MTMALNRLSCIPHPVVSSVFPLQSAILFSVVLTGCSIGERIEIDFPTVVRISKVAALWSIPWTLVALSLYLTVAYDRLDRDSIETQWPNGHTTWSYYGPHRVVRGNPTAGIKVTSCWLLMYPLGSIYWWLWLQHSPVNWTGWPNLDWVLAWLVVPVGIINLARGLASTVRWIVIPLAFLAAANQVIWLSVLLSNWLLAGGK